MQTQTTVRLYNEEEIEFKISEPITYKHWATDEKEFDYRLLNAGNDLMIFAKDEQLEQLYKQLHEVYGVKEVMKNAS